MNIDQTKLLLSVQRALLFSITSIMRFIFVEVDSDGTLKLLVYVQNELSEDELDLLYSAAGEICGDFVELNDSDVEIVVSSDSYEGLKSLKHLVYAKAG